MDIVRDDGYRISDDHALLDRAYVSRWLSEESYWAVGRSREVQDRAIDGSLCVGLYAPDGRQVGFCRFVTDRATFAWLCDVFVDDAHRGRGLGAFMIEAAIEHPDVRDVRRQVLISSSAQGLYERYGYVSLDPADAPKWMLRGR